jgi:TonB family protein
MKRILLIVTLILAVVSLAQAQADTKPPGQGQDDANITGTTQSTELAKAHRLNGLVVKLYSEGKYDEALPLAKQALEITEKAVGPSHQLVCNALTNIAELYIAKKEYGEAEGAYRRSLRIQEKILGPQDPQLSPILKKLAFLHFRKGDYDETETLYRRALTIRENASHPEDVDVAQSLYDLAEFYRIRTDYTKAEPLFERAVKMRMRVLGPSNLSSIVARMRYRCILRKTDPKHEEEKLSSVPVAVIAHDNNKGVMVMGGVMNGKAVSLPKPPYPEAARSQGVSGTVTVQVQIDETGAVIDACAISGSNLLWQVTEQAAYGARFSPTKLSGQPVRVTGVITYNFVAR